MVEWVDRAARVLTQAMANVDAVLFVTPDYSRAGPRRPDGRCNSPLMNQVGADAPFKPGPIAADGEVTDESTKGFLQNQVMELQALTSSCAR